MQDLNLSNRLQLFSDLMDEKPVLLHLHISGNFENSQLLFYPCLRQENSKFKFNALAFLMPPSFASCAFFFDVK